MSGLAPWTQEAKIAHLDLIAPKNWTNEFRIGMFVEVWCAWRKEVIYTGQVTGIIEAGAKPTAEQMALCRRDTPTKASKYKRLIMERRPGAGVSLPVNPAAFRFYALGSPKEER